MTFEHARNEIRNLGLNISRKNSAGEYRITKHDAKRPEWSENIAYYTDDLDDAISTAKAMARELKPIK